MDIIQYSFYGLCGNIRLSIDNNFFVVKLASIWNFLFFSTYPLFSAIEVFLQKLTLMFIM
jgi:hypothetical protein